MSVDLHDPEFVKDGEEERKALLSLTHCLTSSFLAHIPFIKRESLEFEARPSQHVNDPHLTPERPALKEGSAYISVKSPKSMRTCKKADVEEATSTSGSGPERRQSGLRRAADGNNDSGRRTIGKTGIEKGRVSASFRGQAQSEIPLTLSEYSDEEAATASTIG